MTTILFGGVKPTFLAQHGHEVMNLTMTWSRPSRSPSSKEKVVQLFGFRKKEGIWQLTATQML